MSHKQRPPNAPGPNGLRGGRNIYSLKTGVGNWIEDAGGAAVYKRGFTTDDFETECQHQQMGRDLRKPPKFGAALPVALIEPRTTTDMFNPPSGPQDDTWQTSTQTMMKSAGARVLQSSNQIAPSNMDPAKLEAYRKNWTNDTPASRSMRFQTESRRAGNSGTKPEFSVQSVRFLPGTPIAFERLREKLLERYGILGMSALRSALGNAKEVSSADFFKAMKTAAVEVSRVEIQQMLAYLTPTDSFACDKLMHLIKGRIEYTSNIEIKELFALLLYNCGENSNCIGIDQISLLMNARKFMDIAQGLNIYLPCYCIDGCLDVDGFECLCLDMYNSSPNNFTSIMKDLWGAL